MDIPKNYFCHVLPYTIYIEKFLIKMLDNSNIGNIKECFKYEDKSCPISEYFFCKRSNFSNISGLKSVVLGIAYDFIVAIHFNSIAIGVGNDKTSTVVRQGRLSEKYSAYIRL